MKSRDFGFDFGADFRGQIVGGFLGLGEDDELADFEQGSFFQDVPERFPLGVAGDFFPLVADGFQRLQIVFEIGDERRQEILGGKFLGLLLFQQPVNAFLIVRFEQFKNLSDVFLADENVALLKLRNDALVGVDEAPERGQERGETAFEPLHREDFHELGEVALALDFLLVMFARVVGKRCVAGVFEVVRQRTDGFVENFILDLVELVEKRFGVGDFGKLQSLPLQIFAVVFVNLCAGAADHQEFEDFLAGLPGVFADDLEVLLAVVLAVQALELMLHLPEEGFEIADVRDGAVLAGLEQFDLAQDVLRRVVQRRGGNQNDALAATNLREHLVTLRVLGAEAMRLVNEDGGEFLEVAIQQRFQFAEGFAQVAAHAEVAEDIRPRAGIVFVEQVRRRDDEARFVQLLREQRGHVSFAQADHVGQETRRRIHRELCGHSARPLPDISVS